MIVKKKVIIVISVVILVLVASIYFLYFQNNNDNEKSRNEAKWYEEIDEAKTGEVELKIELSADFFIYNETSINLSIILENKVDKELLVAWTSNLGIIITNVHNSSLTQTSTIAVMDSRLILDPKEIANYDDIQIRKGYLAFYPFENNNNSAEYSVQAFISGYGDLHSNIEYFEIRE